MAKLEAAGGSAIKRWITGLRFPWLVGLAAAVLVVDLVVPDVLPFVDEIILAAVTVGLASLRKRRGPAAGGG